MGIRLLLTLKMTGEHIGCFDRCQHKDEAADDECAPQSQQVLTRVEKEKVNGE